MMLISFCIELWAMSFGQFRSLSLSKCQTMPSTSSGTLFLARSSLLVAPSVRDWSGILCERFGNGFWERERGHRACRSAEDSFWVRVGNEASKDIAESPTALPERPNRTNDKSLRTKDEMLRNWGTEGMRDWGTEGVINGKHLQK